MKSNHAGDAATHQEALPWTRRDLPRVALKGLVLAVGLVWFTWVLDWAIPSFPGAKTLRSWLRMTVFMVVFARWVAGLKVPWLRLVAFVGGGVALVELAFDLVAFVLGRATGRFPW